MTALIARLQESLLPTLRISDPGVRVQSFYRPGEKRLQLGGDFYDCIELRDGTALRPDRRRRRSAAA